MIKNANGVTLAILVVTIIVILILAGTTITTSDLLIRDTKSKTITTNMFVVKAKAETVYDDYMFAENTTNLPGTEAKSKASSYVTVQTEDLWYEWNKDTLKSLGLDESMLSGSNTFIVNYATGEVIYPTGVKDDDGNMKHTLSEITGK